MMEPPSPPASPRRGGRSQHEASDQAVLFTEPTLLQRLLTEVATSTAKAHGASVEIDYERGYPPVVNSDAPVERAQLAAAKLAGEGMLPGTLRPAHDFLTRLLVTMRLVAPDGQVPSDATQPILAAALGCADWPAALARLDEVRQIVATTWSAIATGERDGDR